MVVDWNSSNDYTDSVILFIHQMKQKDIRRDGPSDSGHCAGSGCQNNLVIALERKVI